MKNQVILLIFMLIVFHLTSNTHTLESFNNRRRKRRRHRRRKNDKEEVKEDYGNIGITDTIKNIISQSQNKKYKNTGEDKKKILSNINKRHLETSKLIREKTSKNASDAIEKFDALKNGMYDILNYGLMSK